MSRFPLAVLGLAAFGVSLVTARQEPTFQAGTHTVSVYTTVVDANGRLETTLTKDDFEVYDNGIRQELTVFANDFRPITIVIMLDRSGSMVRNFTLVRDAAERLVTNLVDDDKARLGSFSNRIQIDPADFTTDHNELIRILHEELQQPGMTPLWNATSAAMTALRSQTDRKVVLVFTDGFNTPEWRETNVSFRDVRDRAQVESVMVYAIGLADVCADSQPATTSRPGYPRYQRGGPGGGGRGPIGRGPIGRGPIGGPFGRPPLPVPPRGPIGRGPVYPGPFGPATPRSEPPTRASAPCYETRPDPDLRELAAVSGGGYFELSNTDDLGATFARVADELHHQYLLAFAPQVLDGKPHTIDVRLRRQDLTARARRSYVATPDQEGRSPKS